MSAGGYQRAGVPSRLRAAVNARLEEISFRAGVAAATIALVALSAIAAGGVFAATVRLGNQAVAVAGALSSADSPKTTPVITASAQPTTSVHPHASSPPKITPPKTTPPKTAATTAPQSAAGSQPWPPAGGAQGISRSYGRTGFGGYGSWYGGHGSWPGRGGPWHGGQGFGFPGRGR